MLEKEFVAETPELEELKGHIKRILSLMGEDTEREGLLKTPERVAKAMMSKKSFLPSTSSSKSSISSAIF